MISASTNRGSSTKVNSMVTTESGYSDQEIIEDEIETNERGGMQSRVGRSFTLIPPTALQRVAEVMYEGSKRYPRDNWRKISVDDHINHSLNHLTLFALGDMGEDHLGHATTRLLMALDEHIRSGENDDD